MEQKERFQQTETTWRTGFLRVTLIGACIFGLAILIPEFFSTSSYIRFVYAGLYLLLIGFTLLPLSNGVKASVLIFVLYLVGVLGLLAESGIADGRTYMLGAIVLAALLFSWQTGLSVIGIALATYAVYGVIAMSGNPSIAGVLLTPIAMADWLVRYGGTILIALLAVNGIRLTQLEFESTQKRASSFLDALSQERTLLERRVQERTSILDKRTAQLQAVADVGKSITSYRNLSELLQQASLLINENFGYYHVGIFLLDARKEYAVLTATNSEGGKRMLEKGHQLKVGETGIVGYVAANLQARIALDVGADAVFFNNPDLPHTRSEMALPLVASGQILGVLDVQSTEPRAFVEDDIATLQILAEQLAVAIQNANLFTATENALESARATYGQLSREAWTKILRSQPRVGFIATPPTTIQTQSPSLESGIAKAIETGDLILGEDGLTISVPVKIRGQVIGAIRLKKSEIAEAWTQDETNLAIALSDQLSGALESARLYRESQQRAARESLVSDISARINVSSSMDTIIRETVQELGQAIGNAAVTFQLLEKPNGHRSYQGPKRDASIE